MDLNPNFCYIYCCYLKFSEGSIEVSWIVVSLKSWVSICFLICSLYRLSEGNFAEY